MTTKCNEFPNKPKGHSEKRLKELRWAVTAIATSSIEKGKEHHTNNVSRK